MVVSDPGQDTGDLLIRSTGVHLRVQRHESGPLPSTEPPSAPRPSTEPLEAPRPSRTPPPSGEEELQTIRLAAGGRGAGLEALRQRSQSAPQRRQVRVTLLDSQDAPGQDSNSHIVPGPGQDSNSHNAPRPDSNYNMERVSELTESVQRLLHNYRGQALTEETLHRLETLHNQQLTLQNQLLDSALKMAMRPQAPPPAAVPMETLPITMAPPTNRASDSLTPSDRNVAVNTLRANQRTEEAGLGGEVERLRLERVLMQMERLRTDLKTALSREEPEEPPRPRATESPKENRPKSPGTSQKPARSSRVPPPQSDRHALCRLHPTRTPNLPQTPQKSVRKPQSLEVSAGPRQNQRQNEDLEKPQSQRNQECQRDEDRDCWRDEVQNCWRNEPRGHHIQGNSAQYLQNGIKSVQSDSERNRLGAETSEKWTKELEKRGEKNETQQKEKRDEGQGHGKEVGVKQGPGLTVGGLTSGLQARRRVLEGPESPASILDEARLVLKKVQQRKKVLEENLESQLRARSAELLHCRLDALSQNRDCSDEIRIKKTVDSCIRDIQAEMKRSAANQDQMGTKASANRSTAGRRNPTPSGRLLGTNPKPSRTSSKPSVDPVQGPGRDIIRDPEEHHRRLYGKAAHEGQRRSLKKGPYLRLSSPVSPDRRPRPRLLQSVTGVKLKSCKTQTSDPCPGLESSPSLVHSGASFPAVAVPLGRPRTGPSPRAPSPPTPQNMTSPPRVPSSPPPQRKRSPPRVPPPSPPQKEVASQSKASPPKEVTSNVFRSEDERLEQSSDPPVVNILQSSPQQHEEEEAEFPGTNFLSVADLEQSEAASEADRGGTEEVLHLEGGPSPDLIQYQGPDFPPRPPLPSVPEQNLNLGFDTQRDALEERLVQWVEQQLMSRIICDMLHPPLSDPTHSPYTGQSEPQHRPEPAHVPSSVQSESSVASDLDHRDSGLQLQVDSGMDLDPEQVQGLVLEVLTEIVALFLGSRESQDPETEPRTEPGSDPRAETEPTPLSQPESQQILVPTPEATPPQTPPPAMQSPAPATQTPPLSPVATPRATPPLTDEPSVKDDPPPEPVATPPPTPPVTCPDDDTPLVETQDQPEAPPPPESSPAPAAVAPPPGPPSPLDASSSSGSESSESSSTNVTAPRHISEGELLLSLRHLQALHEETGSFSSSLHEFQEMELDPPSEGQVINSNILLQFLNKMQQREPRPAPEGAWGRDLEEDEEVSAGEIKCAAIEPEASPSRSPGQISPITDEQLELTNQSGLSEGLLTSDLLDTPLTQADVPVSAPKRSSDVGLNPDLDSRQTQQIQESPPDQDLSPDQGSPQRKAEDGAGGGVRRGPALMKMEVFVPSVDTAETSGGSDSSSDIF